jgi:hypothetical protein
MKPYALYMKPFAIYMKPFALYMKPFALLSLCIAEFFVEGEMLLTDVLEKLKSTRYIQ